MDIRTKFVFALVAVALGSMLVLGLSMYANAETALRESRLERLEGLAESKQDGLEQVFDGWIDRVSLVASRTQLRLSLRDFNQRGGTENVQRIERILLDAVEAVDVIDALAVFDPDSNLVAFAGQNGEMKTLRPTNGGRAVADGIFYQGVSAGGGTDLRVKFVASLVLDGEVLGTLQVRLDAEPLLYVAEDRSGMGESGETIIVTRDKDGTIRTLHRAGPGGGEVWEEETSAPGSGLVSLALSGQENVYWEEVTDDRGVSVWAAVRNLPEADMGIIVKVDADEGRAPLTLFRRVSTRLALSLGAFAILFGTILGFRFSKPIKDLAEVADRIRGGALSARAVEEGEDEVGLLARTFNDMAGEMEEQVTLLREFQRYFDLSLDMLCIAGPDGYFRRVNPAFERTLGWPTQELLKRSFLEFVHPDDLAKTEEEINRLNRGLPTIAFENRYRVPNGGYRRLAWRAYPDEESGLIYAIARDVTEQRETRERNEARIRALNDELVRAREESGS